MIVKVVVGISGLVYAFDQQPLYGESAYRSPFESAPGSNPYSNKKQQIHGSLLGGVNKLETPQDLLNDRNVGRLPASRVSSAGTRVEAPSGGEFPPIDRRTVGSLAESGNQPLGSRPTAAPTPGIPESDIYPLVEYWQAGDFRPNPLCEGYSGAPKPSLSALKFPFRNSIGLQEMVLKLNPGSKLSSGKKMSPTWRQLTDHVATKVMEGGTGLSYRHMMCNILSKGLGPQQFCAAMGNFSRETQCLTEYSYRYPNNVLKDLAPENNFGYRLMPEECFGRGLKLQQHPITPSIIPSSLVEKELISYHIGWRLLEYLDRYAEYQYMRGLSELLNDALSKEAEQKEDFRIRSDSGDIGIHNIYKDLWVGSQLYNYKVLQVYSTNEPKFKSVTTLKIPYCLLLRNDNEVVVLLRDTVTSYDSRLALSNQLALRYLYNFTGEVHDGATTVYQTLISTLQYHLETMSSRPSNIYIVSKNLPSNGVNILIGYHLSTVLKANIYTMSFGTPYVGDKDFISVSSKTFEIRHIMFKEDITDLFPCPTTFSCDEKVLPPRTGIETGLIYKYSSLPGIVQLDMSLLNWENAGNIPPALQFAAIKDCGYSCALARLACPNDPNIEYCEPNNCLSLIA